MKSKKKRLLRLLLSVDVLFTIFRLAIVAIVIQLFAFSDLPEGVELSTYLTWRTAVLLGIGLLALISLVLDALRLVRGYRQKEEVNLLQTSQFLDMADRNEGEFVLILRPFGGDGLISADVKRGFFKRFVSPGRSTLTVEQIINDTALKVLGASSVCAVDPDDQEVAPGPAYIVLQPDNWRHQIDTLISRAICVVFVFPPHRKVTEHVAWEIERAFGKGLAGRIVALLPDAHDKPSGLVESVIEAFDKHAPVSRMISDTGVDPRKLFLLHLGHEVEGWRETSWLPLPDKLVSVGAQVYEKAVYACFTQIASDLKGRSLRARYPFYVTARRRLRDIESREQAVSVH